MDEDEDQYDEDDLVITAQPHTPVLSSCHPCPFFISHGMLQGPFMTPEVMLNRPARRVPVGMKARASIGIGGEDVPRMSSRGAQRVRTVVSI